MNHATNDEEREQFFKEMQKHRKFTLIHKGAAVLHEFYSRWYNVAIRELLLVKRFQRSAPWIASALSPTISEKDAEKSLLFLEDSGFIQQKKNGNYAQDTPVVSTGPEISSLAVNTYHREMMDRAKDSLNHFSSKERNISSLTMALSKNRYESIVEEIYAFQEKIIAIAECESEADEVYQLNFQMFPLTSITQGESTDV